MSTHLEINSGALTAAEALREHGHRLIDRMADYLATVDERPVSTPHAPGELARGPTNVSVEINAQPGQSVADLQQVVEKTLAKVISDGRANQPRGVRRY